MLLSGGGHHQPARHQALYKNLDHVRCGAGVILEMQANAVTAMASAVTYRFTQRESRLVVQVFAEGLLSAFGHNPKMTVSEFSGEISLNADDLESSVLHALIN